MRVRMSGGRRWRRWRRRRRWKTEEAASCRVMEDRRVEGGRRRGAHVAGGGGGGGGCRGRRLHRRMQPQRRQVRRHSARFQARWRTSRCQHHPTCHTCQSSVNPGRQFSTRRVESELCARIYSLFGNTLATKRRTRRFVLTILAHRRWST